MKQVTRTQTKKLQKKKLASNIIIAILSSAVIAYAIAATFFHNDLPKTSLEYQAHKGTYKPMILNKNAAIEYVKCKLEYNEISPIEFGNSYDSITNVFNLDLKEYNRVKKIILSNDSYIGYTSYKNYMLSTGIRVFLLFVSILYFKSIIKRYVKSFKDLKSFRVIHNLISSGAILFTSAYWCTWSFIYKRNSIGSYDFEEWHQDLLLILIPSIVLLSSFFIIKYLIGRQDYIDSKLIALISDIRKNHYFKMASKAMNNANKASIRKDIVLVDDKIFSTLEEIVEEDGK